MITLRCPEVFNQVAVAAQKFVHERYFSPRTATTPSNTLTLPATPTTPPLIPLPSPIKIVLLGIDADNNNDDDMDDELRQALLDEEPFIVHVHFTQETLGWKSAVYKVKCFEETNQEPTEYWAVKIRVGEENTPDASNKRAFTTMAALHTARLRWLCPQALHYVPPTLPSGTLQQQRQRQQQQAQGDQATVQISMSVLICTWLEGIHPSPLELDLRNKATLRAWTRIIRLRILVASIKKPKRGDPHPPKNIQQLLQIQNLKDHDLWREHSTARIGGLEYLLLSKTRQGILPKWMEFLNTKDAKGMVYMKGIEYRLNACLRRIHAITQDNEDTQELVLCVGDPSLDNIVVSGGRRGHKLRVSLIDLESSGWTDHAYVVAEFLMNNVWFDKFGGLKNDQDFPFSSAFEQFVISTYSNAFDFSNDEQQFATFLERYELEKEFCALKGLLFHVRGALHELGDVIDGFRRRVDTSGSGSCSGGGGTLGGGALSPGKLRNLMYGQKRPKGRASTTVFGKQMLFRRSHREGIEVYLTLLEKSNYMRRCVGNYLTMWEIIDEVREKERKLAEIEEKRLRREHRIRIGVPLVVDGEAEVEVHVVMKKVKV